MAASMINILSPKTLLNASYTCRFLPRVLTNKRTARSYSSSDDNLGLQEDYITEDSVNQMRNFSNLPPRLHNQYLGKVPDEDVLESKTFRDFRERKDYLKKLYATYGIDSGVDPRICWPSKEELAMLKEDEKEWEPSFQNLMAKLKRKRGRDADYRKDLQETVEKNMAKMESLIAAYEKKALRAEEREREAEENRRLLLDEAEEHYGYPVHAGSPEFKSFVKDKREADQKLKKELKKKQKKAMLSAKLQAMVQK